MTDVVEQVSTNTDGARPYGFQQERLGQTAADRPDDLRTAAEAASRRYAMTRLLARTWNDRRTGESDAEPEFVDISRAMSDVRRRSLALRRAVDRLLAEVETTEWQRQKANQVLVARNLAYGRNADAPPAASGPGADRAALEDAVAVTALELEAAYARHLPQIMQGGRAANKNIIGGLLQHESDCRRAEAHAIVCADMTVAAGSMDPDGRQSQGQARAVLRHRWVNDRSARWRGAETLHDYCNAVVLTMASQELHAIGESLRRPDVGTEAKIDLGHLLLEGDDIAIAAAASVARLRSAHAVAPDPSAESMAPLALLDANRAVKQAPNWAASRTMGMKF